MNRYLLALDTAGERCAACVYDMDAERVAARADPVIGRGHAEQLLDLVAVVLMEAGIGYPALARIAVTVGPGSFTGVRVGVAAARGLALALSVPAVGVSTLEALAHPYLAKEPILAVQDAKRGEVYATLFAQDGAVLHAPAALDPAALADVLASGPSSRPVAAVGSGSPIALAVLGAQRLRVLDASGACDIAAVAAIGARREPDAPPRPLYLRGADAKPQAGFAVPRDPA